MSKQKVQKKGKSPYQKYNKRPFKYSSLYQDWKAAIMSGDVKNAETYAEKHRIAFA